MSNPMKFWNNISLIIFSKIDPEFVIRAARHGTRYRYLMRVESTISGLCSVNSMS